MDRTNWSYMVIEKDLLNIKKSRKKIFLSKKILSSDLLTYIDEGWEKSKEYKNKKYIEIIKEKSIQEQFEDEIWMLFSNMGFVSLNSNKLEIAYDYQNDNLKEKVDILAIDDETVIAVQCFASEIETEHVFYSEILSFENKIQGLRKEILKQYPNRKVKFIWATKNYISNRKDKVVFERSGISHFTETMIEYYTDLSKHLGSCSRYQLLGNLFADQEIKNMENRIPAIQGKMGGYTYYSFSIEPEKLLKIGYVLHRSETSNNELPSYQRIIKKNRLKDVRSFINNGGYFPNSIIICIDTKGKGVVFDQSTTKVDNTISKIGVLHIPKRYRSAYIIDGQHRLYGYSDSDYASTNSIPVVAFVDLERSEQIKLFMDINENQKSVPKSLRVTLNADMLWDSDILSEQRQALRSRIAQMLGEESTSPLKGRIIIGESDSTHEKCITVEAIQSALKKCHFFDTYEKKNKMIEEGTFDCGSNEDTLRLFYPFIEKCLLYIREKNIDEWNKGDKDLGILTMNRGIQAVIRVIDDIINMLVGKGTLSIKTQNVENYFSLIEYYLKPLVDYLSVISDEERKDLRGYFGAGADTRFWRTFQKVIAKERQDFCPDGLSEYWKNESKEYNEHTHILLNDIANKIKDITETRLKEYYGDGWLIKGLPKSVYDKAKKLADNADYKNKTNGFEDTEITLWDFIDISDCRLISLSGKNWSTLFSDIFTRPVDEKIVGGKEAKTEWMNKLNMTNKKMSNEKYSVSVDEYELVQSVHVWITNILVE